MAICLSGSGGVIGQSSADADATKRDETMARIGTDVFMPLLPRKKGGMKNEGGKEARLAFLGATHGQSTPGNASLAPFPPPWRRGDRDANVVCNLQSAASLPI